MKGRWLRLAPDVVSGLVAALTVAVVSSGAFRRGFPLDDAWIHMVYGLELWRSGRLAYNAGISSTGCTAPLWDVFAALAHALAWARGPSETAATWLKLLGGGLHVASAVLACRLVRACVPSRYDAAALAAGVLVGAVPIGAFAAVSGMEVPLASALLLAAFLAVARARSVTAGALAGLAAAARPESIVVAPLVVLLARGSWRRRAAALAAAGAVPLLLVVRNLAVSGRPLPATYYAKAHHDLSTLAADLRLGFVDLPERLPPYGSALVWAFAAVSVATGVSAVLRRRADRDGQAVIAGAVVGAVLYVAGTALTVRLVMPGAFYYQRYLLPALPLVLAGAVAGACSTAKIALPAAVEVPAGRARIVAIARRAVLGVLVLAGLGYEAGGWRAQRILYARDVATIDRVQVALGRAIAGALPDDAVVWSADAGGPRYFGQRRTVDVAQLNTRELFHGAFVEPGWWPDAIAVPPHVLQPAAPAGVLEPILEVRSSDEPDTERLGTQVLLGCVQGRPKGADDRVFVLRDGQPLASGRCRRR